MNDLNEHVSEKFAKSRVIIGSLLATSLITIWSAIGDPFVVECWAQQDGILQSESIWTMERWSPYAVGILIGILSWISFLISDKPLGVSTAYARSAGMIEKTFRGSAVEEKAYYSKYVPRIGWEWMLVIGLIAGAFTSATLSGEFQFRYVPTLWEQTFGHTPLKRWLVALVGGTVMGMGARWADGCTSGHGISGTLQLVVSSWIALACFFVGGVAAAYMIY